MRPLLASTLYITALLGALGAAGYLSVELAERLTSREATSQGIVPGTNAYAAKQLGLFTWSMSVAAIAFVVVHAIGILSIRNKTEEDNPLPGLVVYFVAGFIAAIVGGIFGVSIAG
ncbi:MAG: hypothetical protein ACI8T1_002261 [Verrucomicrobiales bacterium]